ncbi:MAG: tetratricopeptide repeat protein [Candidatus Melainabacteria bacterium]|jgi:hypothetical protein|nr:tetratricopeptide repeat protein [Candidatus Melainabacteria bacterium]
MNETRRTKDWITPEILEKSHQKHLMVSREAIDTSDNVGAPLAEAQNILSTFVPNVNDIVSLSSLFDRRFFKLFLLGIALSGLLSLCTIGSQQFFGANKYDWVSLNSSGRSLMWTRRYDEAEKCFKTALALPNLDSAEKACLYGELANLAEKRGDENAAREYSLKEKEFSQVGFGVGSMILAAILLFAMGLSAMFTFKSDKDKVAVGWHQPVVVALATFAFSNGLHNIAPYIPWLLVVMVGSAITLAVLIFSAACDGSRHGQFVTPSR